MTADDLDKRAELTIWPGAGTAQTRQGRAFATLREALSAAVDALGVKAAYRGGVSKPARTSQRERYAYDHSYQRRPPSSARGDR